MIRITTMVLALSIAGCGDNSTESSGSARGRVVSVPPSSQTEPVEDFCEAASGSGEGTALTFPELATGAAPSSSGSLWVNVWATWCEPCVEEMPMLQQWQQNLSAEGVEVDLVFLSVDSSDEAVEAFQNEHPGLGSSLRVADPAVLQEWVTTTGLDAGATLPIHILTRDSGQVSCARTGALQPDDYESLRAQLR